MLYWIQMTGILECISVVFWERALAFYGYDSGSFTHMYPMYPVFYSTLCQLYSSSVTFLPQASEVLCEKSLVSETVRWS